MAPLGLLEPNTVVLISSVGPNPTPGVNGVVDDEIVVPLDKLPTKSVVDDPLADP
jgi:hypothetical protein